MKRGDNFYFKIAKVKGSEYLQIWSGAKCFHIGSAAKILKLVGISPESVLSETKLTKSEKIGLTFQESEESKND
jgi:hypothetical protein